MTQDMTTPVFQRELLERIHTIWCYSLCMFSLNVEYFCALNVSQDDSFNSKNASVIGLLDIYGFEVFQNNR